MEMNFSNPPIKEALVDIRFNFGVSQPNLNTFEKVYEKIKNEYPKKQTLKWGQFSVNINEKNAPVMQSSGGDNGYRFDSNDGTKIVQFRTDGFTFSKLKPYTGWEDFSSEAKKLLAIYMEVASPSYASRIALRYINLIEVPETSFELEKYFTISSKIPEGLPQDVVGYLNRVILKDDSSKALAILTQTINPQQVVRVDTKKTPFLFDIDVFIDNVSLKLDNEKFWDNFKPLRILKNKIFDLGLTEVTKSYFK